MSQKAPKRNNSQTAAGSSKRVRISEEAIVDNEQAFDAQVLEDLESRPVSKKAVKNEGYDSDSSDDGEGVVLSRRSGVNEAADDDDDDMFAPSSSTQDTTNDLYSKKKKDRKFLDLGDIEGQEFGDSGSDGPEDDDDAGLQKKKMMGYEISSFNMKSEMEEGKFDQDGTFVRSIDPHAIHDKWMEGMDDKEMRKARKSKKIVEEKERQKAAAREEEESRGKEELMKELLGYLDRSENTLEALQRLGKQAKKKEKVASSKAKGKGVDTDQQPSPIERVTALASSLMSLGVADIYDETYDSMLRTVRRAGIVPEDWTPPILNPSKDSKVYEYRWDPALGREADTTKTFGPFSENEIIQWRDALYFGGSGERIQLRRVGDTNWTGWGIFDQS